MPRRRANTLTNAQIAELLAREAATAKMPAQKALRRASRRAFFWPEEAADLHRQGRSLTELTAVGPYLQRLIAAWLEDPPEVPDAPDVRQGFLTLTEARATLGANPAWLREIKGDLQMHSTWSDGEGTIAEMAGAAVERGYEYIAITDHSKGLKIAGGIDEQQLLRQAEEIAEVNAQLRKSGHKLGVLRSIELNLNPRGEGDMEPSCFPGLELVLGCFHSSLRTKEDQTARYIAALRNPAIQILGHPRGRVYNYRVGLSADWPRVFDEAARLDKALEIDGYPDRQDLNVDLLRLAKKSGCRISLGTDSHGPTQLGFMEYSAAAALHAGIKRDRILNFMSLDELKTWVESLRSRSITTSRRIPRLVAS
jgi:histidinol phosphatase-like PHP family hydrolase